MPAFPGIRQVANITYLALELNKWPSEVYERLLVQPRDVELCFLALDHRAKKEKKEHEKLEEEQERIKRRQAMR